MKKLIIGKVVETRIATCNWCGESEKDCFKAVLPEIHYFHSTSHLKDNKELKWLRAGGFFSTEKLYWVIKEPEYETSKSEIGTSYSDICRDCVKQLANEK